MPIEAAYGRALSHFDRLVEMSKLRRWLALFLLSRKDPEAHAHLAKLLDADAMEEAVDIAQVVAPADSRHPEKEAAGQGGAPSPRGALTGTMLGKWEVGDIIGVGGMGVVYAASRADGEYEHHVAIKSLRIGDGQDQLPAAFRIERNLLAKLNHPAIVPILDGGVDSNGRPWFAMPRVDGAPIDAWCDSARTSLRGRVRLFLGVCAAVRHAHERGILHCDIKPGNVLVDTAGNVKLLDFGLSSLRGAGSVSDGMHGVSNAYSAPELICGGSPEETTDVYSLGMLLYRLVCGSTPHQPFLATLLLGTEGIGDSEPTPPSALAARAGGDVAIARSTRSARHLASALQGGMDAICRASVRPAQEGRYQHVAELEEDLQAWLTGMPTRHERSAWQRVRLFAKRHALALAAAFVVVAVVGALGGISYSRIREANRDLEANQVVSVLFGDAIDASTVSGIGNARLNTPGTLDELERQLRHYPEKENWRIRAQGLNAIARSHAAIADYATALRLAEEAKRLGADDPLQQARSSAVLASIFNLRSMYADAQREAQSGIHALGESKSPVAPSLHAQLIKELAESRWGVGDHAAALSTITREIDAIAPSMPGADALTALLLISRGQWRGVIYEAKPAEADLRRAIALTEARNSDVADTARLALSFLLRTSPDAGLRKESLDIAAAVVANRTKRFGSDHPETGRALVAMALAQINNRQWSEARGNLDAGMAVLRKTLGPESPELVVPYVFTAVFNANDGGSPEETERLHRLAYRIALKAHGPAHQVTYYARRTLGVYLSDSVRHGRDRDGRMAREAARLFETNIRLRRGQGLPAPQDWTDYTRLLLQGDDLAKASMASANALAQVERYQGRKQGIWLAVKQDQVQLLYRMGKYADADREAELGIRVAREQLPTFLAYSTLTVMLEFRVKIAQATGDRAGVVRYGQELAQADKEAQEALD